MDALPRSTCLVDIREFLQQQKIDLAPWAAPDEVIARLYGALADRAHDRRFWRDLRRLVARLDDRRFDPAPLRGARVLREDDLGQLVDDLRTALGENGDGSRRFWLHRGASAAAIVGFVVLGLALACNPPGRHSSSHDDDDDDTWDDYGGGGGGYQSYDHDVYPCDAAFAFDEQGMRGTVVCLLFDVIDRAQIAENTRGAMFLCIGEMDHRFRVGLLKLFQMADDATVAGLLEHLTSEGEFCADSYANYLYGRRWDENIWEDGGH